MLALAAALVAAAAGCATPAPPPSAGTEAGSQVTPSLDATTLRAPAGPNTSAFTEGKPCELLTPEEVEAQGLRSPGSPSQTPFGLNCFWGGRDFSLIITVNSARSLAHIEASRRGQRITVAARRAASMAKGDGQFAGVCDLALDVSDGGSADIFLSRKDKNSDAACLNAIEVASLLHPRLP